MGSALVRALAARGDVVRVLARMTSDLSPLDGLDVEVVRGDVLQPDTLRPATSGWLAWSTKRTAIRSIVRN